MGLLMRKEAIRVGPAQAVVMRLRDEIKDRVREA